MNNFLKKIVWLIILAPACILAILWKKIPENLATHFDFHGNPDQFGKKSQLWLGIGLITLISGMVYLLLKNAYLPF